MVIFLYLLSDSNNISKKDYEIYIIKIKLEIELFLSVLEILLRKLNKKKEF